MSAQRQFFEDRITDEQRANVEAWIAALESGDYSQGISCLHHRGPTTDFCCLGVAADISELGEWKPSAHAGKMTYRIRVDVYNSVAHATVLTGPLIAHYGLAEGRQVTLAAKNDSGIRFAAIAEMLRRDLAVPNR